MIKLENSSKPVVVVSRCLGFESCRYNGQLISDEFVSRLKTFVQYITVCPEVGIGLGTPRETLRLVSVEDRIELYQPATGKEFSGAMINFSNKFLSSLKDVDAFILKGRSPSCGIKDVKVYIGKEKPTGSIKGSGIFAKIAIDKFPSLSIEEEGRLTNFRIREHFLTKLFTLFRFRAVKNSHSMAELVKFQSDNKYLLMSYHQREQKLLGKIVANHDKRPFNEVIKDYEEHLGIAFLRPPKYTTIINAMMHIFGYFSDELSHDEKVFVLDTFEKYKKSKIPASVPLHLLKSYAIKYNHNYLLEQTLWCPYPEDLIDISNSGKSDHP